jgi:hypothetical protein
MSATRVKSRKVAHSMPVRCASKKAAQGYALLLVMFFLALLAIAVAAASPNILTEGRREKEQEMVWRGQQYVRGIRLYYQRTHRLPSRLEDLYAPKTGIRFLRRAYKDPLNSADGSWRLISVAPNGQLLGSLKEHRNAFFFGAPASQGFAGALSPTATKSAPSTFSSDFGKSDQSPNTSSLSSQKASNMQDPIVGGQPAVGAQSATVGSTGDSPDVAIESLASAAAALNDQSQTLGQTIVGVGSKVNRSSMLRYEGAKNYLQFEFVWNGTSN